MAKQVIFLKVYKDSQLHLSRQFISDQISIGSGSEGPSMVLSDPSVNYWHALIEKRGDSYAISDLGSPTGTFVNKKQILESSVQHGDRIGVGEFEIHFFIGVPFAKPVSAGAKTSDTPLPQAPQQEVKPKPSSIVQSKSKMAADTVISKLPEGGIEVDSKDSKNLENSEEPVVRPLQKTEVLPVAMDKKEKSVVKDTAPAPETVAPQSPSLETSLSSELPSSQRKSKPTTLQDTQNSGNQASELESQALAKPATDSPLDQSLQLGAGSIVEVLVTWKDRILKAYHFDNTKVREVTFGSNSSCDICFPNLLGVKSYKLLSIHNKVMLHIADRMKVKLIHKKGESSLAQLINAGLVSTSEKGQSLAISIGQLARLDFGDSVRVYVRYVSPAHKAALAPVLDFSVSEMMGIMMSCVFMFFLMVYLAIFSVEFLNPEETLETENIQKAKIEFKPMKRPVRLQVAKKKAAFSIPQKKKPKKRRKKSGFKKPGKMGRMGSVAANKKVRKKKRKKPAVVSARPGGSVTTKKSGAAAKSPRKDPTKIGLLGVFGSKGTQKVLDQAYSGTGELAGLAETSTGYAGQKDSYKGEGIGTKFKETGSGKGSAMIGIASNIRTRGKGGGSKGYGSGGPLGRRGRVNLVLGSDDWEVGGGVNRDAILRIIRRNKYQIESCYGATLQKTPDLEGKVRFQWEIDSKGKVRNIKVIGNSTGSGALASCIATRLRRFRFDGVGVRPGQVGVVKIPFAVTKK